MRSITRVVARRRAAGAALALTLACGGSNQAPKAPAPDVTPQAVEAEAEPDLATSAELGGLNEDEAQDSFRASLDGLQRCMGEGLERLPYLGGEIELAVQIDTARKPARVWASQSTLGERATEKCMFDALRAVSWPKPVGGAYGIARTSFVVPARKGMPEPAVWDAGRVGEVLSELEQPLSSCRASDPAELLITMYIGQGGKALSGGVSSRDAVDEAAADCVIEALLAAQFPEPEQSPTKVRFTL